MNALWDAAPLVGDRVASSARGWSAAVWRGCSPDSPVSRCSSSTWTRRGPPSPRRSASEFVTPDRAAGERDLVVHASATEDGLARSLELLGDEATVVELSWYGDRRISVPLGEAFHSRRLVVRGSQVGAVSQARRARRSYADRLALALRLLADPAFDALITGECRFADLPEVMPRLATGDLPALCHRVIYDATGPGATVHTTPTPVLEESTVVQHHRPRPPDGRAQLPRRGLRTGATAARRDVRRGRDLPPRRARRGQHRRRHRAGHPGTRRRRSPRSTTATSTTSPTSPASTPRPSSWRRSSPTGSPTG